MLPPPFERRCTMYESTAPHAMLLIVEIMRKSHPTTTATIFNSTFSLSDQVIMREEGRGREGLFIAQIQKLALTQHFNNKRPANHQVRL